MESFRRAASNDELAELEQAGQTNARPARNDDRVLGRG